MAKMRSCFYFILIGVLSCCFQKLQSMEKRENLLVFLKGNSSTGKSSISKEILQMDSHWKIVSEDAIFFDQFPIYWEELFPAEFKNILKVVERPHLVHAIMRDQIYFKQEATEEEKKAALEAIATIRGNLSNENDENIRFKAACTKRFQNYVFNQINDHLENGFYVLVDTANGLKKDKIDKLSEKYKIVNILAYCPLNIAIDRVAERNHIAILHGDFISLRFYHQILSNFLGLYDMVSASKSQGIDTSHSIDGIAKETMKSIFDFIGLSMIESCHAVGFTFFSWGEFDRKELEKFRELMLSEFADDSFCTIIPKDKFDYLIYTDKRSAQETAEIILKDFF